MFFEAVERRQRIGMLTLYNIGFAAATVGGALCGGAVLSIFGQRHSGYMAVFALSALARLSTVPLFARIGGAENETAEKPELMIRSAEIEADGDQLPNADLLPNVIELVPPMALAEDLQNLSAKQVA